MSTISSELLKMRTTRVPYVLAAVVALISGVASAGLVGADALDEDPALALLQGTGFALTLSTILGILLVTNEYRHGTIATTFLVTPHRARVLAAKLAAGVVAGAAYALVALVTTAAVALPWLDARGQPLPFDVQLLEAVGRLIAAFVLSAAIGVAVGAVARNQVGAIVATFVWFLIAEPLIAVVGALIHGDVGDEAAISRYLPGAALNAVAGGSGLRAGPAIALAAAYVAVLAALGALAMVRRDP